MVCQEKKTLRLRLEELEDRSLLAGDSAAATPDLVPTNPNGASVLPGGGFPAEVAAVAASAISLPAGSLTLAAGLNLNSAGTSAFGVNTAAAGLAQTPGAAIVLTGDGSTSAGLFSRAPDANSGVGQMLLTTGANTPGLGSFATSTLGYASENGGRSGG